MMFINDVSYNIILHQRSLYHCNVCYQSYKFILFLKFSFGKMDNIKLYLHGENEKYIVLILFKKVIQ